MRRPTRTCSAPTALSSSGGSPTDSSPTQRSHSRRFLGALSILALRGFLLPRWLGWFGLVLTVVLLIPPLGWLALLFLFPLWLIIASVILLRTPQPVAASV